MAALRRSPSDDLVACVVAWHNRNPLARRIGPAQVVSVGLVSFPFFAPPGQGPAPAVLEPASVPAAPAPASQPEAPAVADPSSAEATSEAAAQPPPGAAAQAAAEAASEAVPSVPEAATDEAAPVPHQPAAPPAEASGLEAAGGSLRERARVRAATAGDPSASGPASGPTSASASAKPGSFTKPAARRLGGAKGWTAAFRDELLDPSTPQQLARWALRHGSVRRPGPADALVRELEAVGAAPRGGSGVVRLWVFTAAIDLGAQRVRVLVAPNDARRVLGPRIIARSRVGGFAAIFGSGALAAAVSVFALGVDSRLPGRAAPVLATQVAPAMSAASAAPAAPTPAGALAAGPGLAVPVLSPPVPAQIAPQHAGTGASVPHAAAPPAHAAVAPTHADAVAVRPAAEPADEPAATPPGKAKPIRHIVPFLSESVRQAAREEGEALRAERAQKAGSAERLSAGAPPARVATAGAAGAAARGVPPRAVPAAGAAWAVSTRNLRTRFESEQMLAALRDVAYRSGHGSELKLEVLPAGEDWRAVGWPLASRAEAERLRAALAARGLKAEVMQF